MLRQLTSLTLIGCIFCAPNKLPLLDGRIVGGIPVAIEDYPYQISLLYMGEHICGGSIISSEWIVSAAHCTYETDPGTLSIHAGSTRLSSGGIIIQIESVYIDPDFDIFTIDYDISLLRLKSPLKFGAAIAAVDLPDENEELVVDSQAVVTGWGNLVEYGDLSDVLQVVQVPIISSQKCRQVYGELSITDRMFCAGLLGKGGKDACQGDSGGPLVIDGKLIGIVSWGTGCAEANFPGVYSSVSSLRSFITETAGF